MLSAPYHPQSPSNSSFKRTDMNLYKISQDVNDEYETYDSAIVAAENEDDARMIHPNKGVYIKNNLWYHIYHTGNELEYWDGYWVPVKDLHLIKVELIGTAKAGTERGVILASFNGG